MKNYEMGVLKQVAPNLYEAIQDGEIQNGEEIWDDSSTVRFVFDDEDKDRYLIEIDGVCIDFASNYQEHKLSETREEIVEELMKIKSSHV